MNFENALVRRTFKSLHDDQVEICEVWDVNHPECPFVFLLPPLEPFVMKFTTDETDGI
jgi:hypothetical protein